MRGRVEQTLSRSTVAPRRFAVGLLAFLSLTGLAGANAFVQNDAGSGHDAGGSWASPLALSAYGSYSGTLVEHDTDAYVVPQASSTPACVNFSFAPASADLLTVRAASAANGDASASFSVASGQTLQGGLATNAYDSAGLLATLQDPELDGHHDYAFSLQRSDIQSMAIAAAGHSLSTAPPLSGPCVAGDMSPVNVNNLNTYSLGNLPAGTALVASLAAGASDLVLQVMDANGNVISMASVNGVASVTIPVSGTYYLGVARTDFSVQDVQYLVGIVADPGPLCQPAC